jgi:1-acyl-sn-glycerol-3-phosphate acyltransferase
MARPRIPFVYRLVMAVATPFLRWWGRMQVLNLDLLPVEGPVLLLANHESYWDTVAAGTACLPRRQIRALAKIELWRNPAVGWVLNQMGQIPVKRGSSEASNALEPAIDVLRAGGCIGVFPEGSTSRGRVLQPKSGAGRLLLAVPHTQVFCVRITGTVDVIRFPKRPKIVVEFFEPTGGQPQPGETATEMVKRFTAEIRRGAPPQMQGRKRKVAKQRAVLDRQSSGAS